jgi:hypothetical protein
MKSESDQLMKQPAAPPAVIIAAATPSAERSTSERTERPGARLSQAVRPSQSPNLLRTHQALPTQNSGEETYAACAP